MSVKKIKRLYIDLETSPNIVYTWNVGYDLNIGHENIIKERAIICACYKWEGDSKVHAIKWNNGDDSSLIEQLLWVMLEADEIVAHNGDRFDIKWFRTRCLYHGVQTLPEFKTIDTLKISKDKFKFNSNKLDYIAQYLGYGGKIKTDFDLWKKVLNGDKKSLVEMIEYCKNDIIILEKVYKRLEGYAKHKTHVGVLNGGTKCDCPMCGSSDTHSKGNAASAAGVITKRMVCNECNYYFKVALTTYNKERLETE